MKSRLFFEDLVAGDTFESPGRTVTESDVYNFAGLSGDYNEVHTNSIVGEQHFGGRIAHGILVLAIQSGLGQRAVGRPIATIALLEIRKWQFLQPVRFGDTVLVRTRVVDLRRTSNPTRGVVTWLREVVNQEGTIVQSGETVTMVACREDG